MKKLAILGSGNSLSEAPFNNIDFEFWGQNNLFLDIPKDINITAWFQLHSIGSAEEFQFLQALNCPVFQMKCNSNLVNSRIYPIESALLFFNYKREKVIKHPFHSTVSFMLALAIMNGYKEIYLYGIDCKHENYQFQKDSIAFFIGYAKHAGIEIILPGQSEVLKPDFIYQYDETETIQFTREIFFKHMKS